VFQAIGEWWKSVGAVGAPPNRVGADIVEVGTGVFVALQAVASLIGLARQGRVGASRIDKLSCGIFLRSFHWAAYQRPDRWEGDTFCNSHVQGPKRPLATADRGIYANLNNGTEEDFLLIANELGILDHVLDDPRFAAGGRHAIGTGRHAREVRPIWEAALASWSAEDAVRVFNERGGNAVEFRTAADVFDHPQVQAQNLVERGEDGASYLRAPWEGTWPRPPLRARVATEARS
jgi:crotonobetainyl-CoA:carnitine CoA-transferase CaiB-like acyl-CoA transferase